MLEALTADFESALRPTRDCLQSCLISYLQCLTRAISISVSRSNSTHGRKSRLINLSMSRYREFVVMPEFAIHACRIVKTYVEGKNNHRLLPVHPDPTVSILHFHGSLSRRCVRAHRSSDTLLSKETSALRSLLSGLSLGRHGGRDGRVDPLMGVSAFRSRRACRQGEIR